MVMTQEEVATTSSLTVAVSDDVLHAVATRLDPAEVVAFCLADHKVAALTRLRRQATQLARRQLRMRLRQVRQRIKHREEFVAQACKVVSLRPPEEVIEDIEGQLVRSPDGIRDLSSAVQKALTHISAQSVVAPAHVQRLHSDLVNVATFVCLFVWRLHLRSQREQQMLQRGVQVLAEAQPATDAALVGQQEEHPSLLTAGSPNTPSSSRQQQHQPQQAESVSRGMQTDLGSNLSDIDELLEGFRGIVTASNPSMRACRASLNLLLHFLQLELLAWNPLVMPLI